MDNVREHRIAILAAAGLSAAAVGTYYVLRSHQKAPKAGPYTKDTLPENAYDAIIVGAGPSGSTAAYYLARSGAKVKLLY